MARGSVREVLALRVADLDATVEDLCGIVGLPVKPAIQASDMIVTGQCSNQVREITETLKAICTALAEDAE